MPNCKNHPLKRALRADKLDAGWRRWSNVTSVSAPEALAESTTPSGNLRVKRRVRRERRGGSRREAGGTITAMNLRWRFRNPCLCAVGSSSLPVDRLPSAADALPRTTGVVVGWKALGRWRTLPVPVIGRIYDGRLWLDMRCLEDRFYGDDAGNDYCNCRT